MVILWYTYIRLEVEQLNKRNKKGNETMNTATTANNTDRAGFPILNENEYLEINPDSFMEIYNTMNRAMRDCDPSDLFIWVEKMDEEINNHNENEACFIEISAEESATRNTATVAIDPEWVEVMQIID